MKVVVHTKSGVSEFAKVRHVDGQKDPSGVLMIVHNMRVLYTYHVEDTTFIPMCEVLRVDVVVE